MAPPTPEPTASPPQPGREERPRLDKRTPRGRALWRGSHPTVGTLLVTALAALLGLAMSVQVRQTRNQGLESLRQSELVSILDTVDQRARRLADEEAALIATREQLRSGQANEATALAAARRRLDAAAVLAGAVPVFGPGVTVSISDANRSLRATTILDVVHELRDAGAEAIEVGPVRVVASTAFTDTSDTQISADGSVLTQPYVVHAVGDADTLGAAMAIPGGVIDSVRQVGAEISVAKSAKVEVKALHAAQRPRYAQPVPEATSGATP